MEIIFLRHGPAGRREDWAKTGRPDSERPLTPEGFKRAKESARGLARIAKTASLVVTSPWTRARQTAELAAKALGAPMAESNFLLPHRSPASLAGWLSGLGEARVVLVGHEPHLSRCVAWLMTGSGSRSIVGLKKSQAALLETEKAAAGSAVLVWSLPPGVLRRLA